MFHRSCLVAELVSLQLVSSQKWGSDIQCASDEIASFEVAFILLGLFAMAGPPEESGDSRGVRTGGGHSRGSGMVDSRRGSLLDV